MKNRFGLLAAWLLATALAVGVASQAVGLVADRAVGIPAQIPVAASGQSALGPLTTTPTDPLPAPTTSTTAPPTSSPTTTATGGTTTTSVAAATTTTTIVMTTTTNPPPLDSRTFFLEGGQVSAVCTGAQTVAYLGGFPQLGWSLELKSSGPQEVKVDFESGEEEIEIKIACHNGQLHEEVHEESSD